MFQTYKLSLMDYDLITALSAGEAPTASTVTQGRHVRTKRCSCATFLDKECVYFCHLDIIWVNTPERVVSYGLGDAPRTRRAVADSMATRSGPRCQCARDNDNTCRTFCRPRYEPWPHSAEGDGCTEPQCKHKLAAHRGRINRMKGSNKKRVSPLVLRAASKTGLVLKNWRGEKVSFSKAIYWGEPCAAASQKGTGEPS
uniref:Endothelin-1 n=1 Tax=Monopterus albus TaxID=43700 RepID=A0A3Q3JU47_MONAL